MAINLDTAIRLSAQVTGLDQFKSLTDRLLGVKAGSADASSAFQQLSGEANRLTQESVKVAGGVKVQSAALQDLGTKARSGAMETKRAGVEMRGLGGILAGLRGQSAGVLDGVVQSSGKAANGIREFQRTLAPTDAELAKVRDQLQQLAGASKTTEQSIKQQTEALKRLKSQAEVGGQLYQQLTADIDKLGKAGRDVVPSFEAGAKGAQQFGKATTGNREAIRQQIEGLQRLSKGLEGTGDAAEIVTGQIETLTAAAKREAVELGNAWEPGIRGLKLLAKASAETTQQQSSHMDKLKGVLAQAGEGYRALGRQIQDLKAKAEGLDLSKGLTVGNVAQGAGSAIQSIVQMRRELARSMTGRVVLTGEGLATAGVVGAAGAGTAAGIGGLAGGAQAAAGSLDAIAAKAAALPGLLKPLGGLLSEPVAAAANSIGQLGSSLAAAQGKLQALSAPFEAIGTAISAIGPEASAAAGVASLAIAGVYQVLSKQADEAQADLERSFKGISDSAQDVLQQLVRIYDKVPAARLQAQEELRQRNLQRLSEVPSDSIEARRAANAVAVAEREIAQIRGEQDRLVENARKQQEELQRQKQELQRMRAAAAFTPTLALPAAGESSYQMMQDRARQERRAAKIAQIEAIIPPSAGLVEAAPLNEAVEIARKRLQVQRDITAESKRSHDWEWLRNREAKARLGEEERLTARLAAYQDDMRRKAAEAFAPSRVLALPAAGQTSFQGTVNAAGLGGGARRLQNFETAGTSQVVGAAMGTGAAGSGVAQAAGQARGQLAELYLTIDRVTQSSNGSINSLQRQRSAWEALRNAVNPAAPAYAKATREVESLDKRLQALTVTQEKQERQSIGREALGGALGSLAAGGGVQGAVSALAGGLAFSGGAAGIAAGAGISAVLGVGALAIRVGVEAETAQVRLKALTDQFGEYNQAQAAAARIASTLRISTVEAQDGFGKLYAALRPTGVTLQEIEDAFVGFTAAARASGATAEESSYALLQLKQALGSGILQGDELRSIREQAPAVGQAIAKEMGVTIGELKKLGEQGKITTDIVLRALARLRGEKLDQLNQQFDTSAQAIKDLQIATQNFGRIVAQVFGPAAVGLLKGFTFALQGVNAAATDAANALTKPKAYAAEVSIRQGRLPMGTAGAAELFKGSSGTGGIGLTGIIAEAKELSRLRRQPYNDVLLSLMQNRLGRIDLQQQGGTALQQQEREAAAGERAAARRRAAASASDAAAKTAGKSSEFQPSSRARALMAAADKLGVSPLDLATIISFETGGTFSPSKMGGAGGNYMGLIQFGPNERKAYGARPNQSFEEQVTGPVVRYFQDRFGKVGMSTQGASLEDLYTTVLAGNPMANRNARDSFGTSPRSGVQRMGPHRQKALSTFFGGSMANVEVDPLKRAESANQAYEQINEQRKAAEDLLKTERNRLRVLEASDPLQRQVTEALIKQSDIQDEYARKLAESRSPQEERALKLARDNALRANSLELERALADTAKDAMQPLEDAVNAAADKLAFEREYGELIARGVNPELARQFTELDRTAAKAKEKLELQVRILEAQAAELPVGDQIRKNLEEQIKLLKQRLKLIPTVTDQAKKDTTEEDKKRKEREKREQDAQDAAERAKQLYRGIVNTIEDGIVGSIQAGLDSLIDGTKKLDQALKEIAAGVLKEISNQLLRFAINAGMRAIFPGAFADGGVFTSGGVQAFAGGGTFTNSIVSSPTMFKFADGGAMRTGLMGEAGPEAIMPLRRGPDGRLGVDASGLAVPFQRPTGAAAGAELEVPFQRTAAGLEVPFLKDGAAAAGSAAAGAATIDVRFETVRIGDLDVVTREEAQRIGRESAQRGAELAHKRYRNNPSARRAAGLA